MGYGKGSHRGSGGSVSFGTGMSILIRTSIIVINNVTNRSGSVGKSRFFVGGSLIVGGTYMESRSQKRCGAVHICRKQQRISEE